MFLLCLIGLFDVLKCFEQLANTLQHSASHEFVLVLPVSRDHLEDVTCWVDIVKGLYHLGELGFTHTLSRKDRPIGPSSYYAAGSSV